MAIKIARYGWLRDLPDHRDEVYALGRPPVLPPRADLRALMPPVYDQGELGSCTGNACAAAIAYARAMQGLPAIAPSRLMLYYGARSLEGTAASDSGAQIRNVIKAAARWGACDEAAWPYDVTKFAAAPSPEAYAVAVRDRAIGYRRVPQDLGHLRACLAAGDPVVFGFTVYASFESPAVAQTGTVPPPAPGEAVIGGHAVLAVGYDDTEQRFIVRNSWGAGWGLSGYCLMPYRTLTSPSLADDFWTIRLATP